jgi:cell division protein FtsZ
VGVGGAGNNCVRRLSEMGIKGANTIAVNTDAKHLSVTKADKKLLI